MNGATEVTAPKKRGSALPWLLFLLTFAGLGAVFYFGRDLLESERSRSAAAEKTATEASLKLTEAEASRRALEERVKALEGDKATLSQSMTQLSENLEDAQAELARVKATYDSLEEKMHAEIKKGEIKLTQSEGRIQVDLVDKVLFDSGQADLSPRGQEVLSRVAAVLKDVDDKTINVSGHTDDSPITDKLVTKYPTNWELSVARAVNVVRYLNEQGKVPAKRLTASGYGQYHPVASNANATGRAKNRRIEILLAPEIEKAPKPVVQHAVAKKEEKPPVKVTPAKTPAKVVATKTPAKAPAKKK